MTVAMRVWQWLLVGVQGACGLVLAKLGWELLGLGGSPYYLAAGAALAITALLVALRSAWAARLYAAFFAATVIWALWEVGLDGWALAPRVGLPAVLGLWMLTPWIRTAIRLPARFAASRVFWPALALGVPLAVAASFWLDRPAGGHGPIDASYAPADPRDGEWLHYGNDAHGTRYSPLAQITPENVGRLQPVWTYHAGFGPGPMTPTFETTPIKVGERLYFCTGYSDVIALDAETGAEAWRFDARVDTAGVVVQACRGVTYYRAPGIEGACAARIYAATVDARLIALDAASGRPCEDFGEHGAVDLKRGMGDVDKGYYYATSPPQLVRGRLVLGGWVMDGQHTDEPSGVIRAFDAVTGALLWAFDIGRPDMHGMPAAGETFTRGTPNSWAPMSADEELGLLYAPTGNATPDYVGEHRSANDDRFSSSVVALDVDTGALRWSFQTTHRDLWDYDVASQPTLVDLADGTKALLQPTKRGEVFLLDRATGKPVAEVTEKPAPQEGAVEGEWFAATQPFSTGMPSFAGLEPGEKRTWGLTPIDHALCRIEFRAARFDGTMTPIGIDRPTVVWPGYLGGIDWGGVTVDPRRQLMFVNSTGIGNYDQLMPRAEADRRGLKPLAHGRLANLALAVPQAGTRYAAAVRPWLSSLGVPCQQPPYGWISAVDLRTRRLVWQQRFGTGRDSGPWGLRTMLPIPMGVPNVGGSVATAGGLLFIAATIERTFRAYGITTGRELWQARLPAGGQATPATYWSSKSNRQFVVIAAGGHPAFRSGSADALIAYALPAGN